MSYINIGSDKNPIFTMVNENFRKNHEIVGSDYNENNLPNIEKFKKTKFVQFTTNKFKINFDQLKGISCLKVEYLLIIRLKGKIFAVMKLILRKI